MKDAKDKLYDAVKETERLADEVASHHAEGCTVRDTAEWLGRTMHAIGHQVDPDRPCDALPSSGPPQVATPAYRKNWETIFGKPIEPGRA